MPAVVRSPLTAGALLMFGASAMVGTPAVPVSLTAFDSPLTELLETGLLVNNDIFNGSDIFGDYEWEPYQGALPEFIYTALPILSQMGFNGAADIGGTVDAVGTSAIILSQAVWNLPAAVVTATQQAISGDISGAITTLTNATLVPVQSAAATVLSAVGVVVNAVVTRFTNFVAVVPGILAGLVNTTVGSVQAVITAAVSIVTQTVGALSTGDVETAWNTVVDGLLGPVGADGTVESSIPGTIEAVTLGPGLGPLGNPNGYAVPSLRMWGEQSQLQIANAIGASYPVPAAAQRSAAQRSGPQSSAAKTARSAAAAKPASSVKETRRR